MFFYAPHHRLALWIACAAIAVSFSIATLTHCSETKPRLISRSEQRIEDTWNLKPLFPGLEEWKQAFQKECCIDYDALLSTYKSSTKLNAKEIRELLDIAENLERPLDKLYTYAYLNYVQDVTNNEAVEALQAATARQHKFFKTNSWIRAKILSHEKEEIEEFVEAPELAPYSLYLRRLLREKPHFLSMDQEILLSLSEPATKTPQIAFQNLTEGDLVFPEVLDSEGKKHPLSYTLAWDYLRNPDRTLRKNSFEVFLGQYKRLENALAALLLGQVQSHFFYAQARGYSSCLEASLYPHEIPISIYHNLIATVKKQVSVFHRYISLVKKFQQLDAAHYYDIHPIAQGRETTYTYDEAVSLILEACSPLGPSYVEQLKKGLTTDRWVDRYENAHKRQVSFSHGCYDSPPYIHVNFSGTLGSVFLLAHEAGHSMHSELSRKQPFRFSTFPVYQYPFFIAEIASTFHEALLSNLLLQKSKKNPELQRKLIFEQLDHMRIYLWDQVLFAEFELFLHESVEQGRPITPKILSEKTKELYAFYYGKDLVVDDLLGTFWAEIPHYYFNFYVYQYATGISAAEALCEKVLQGGEAERTAYLDFLEAGRSQNSLDLLRTAGVDMTSGEPIEEAIRKFDRLLDIFEDLIDSSAPHSME